MTTDTTQIQNIKPNQQDKAEPSYEKTAGEKWHRAITYQGVDWLVNTAFAVSFAWWSNRTDSGQHYFSKPVTGFFDKVIKPIVSNDTLRGKMAAHGTTFASIMAGGTAIIPIMMALENKGIKRNIVEAIDRKTYGDEEVNTNERFAARYEAIKQESHKGFWTGMGARIAILTPMLAGHMRYRDEYLNPYMYKPTGDATRKVTDVLHIKPKRLMERTYQNSDVKDWDYIHNVLGMDLSLTLIYSILHEGAYKWIANQVSGGKNTPPSPVINTKDIDKPEPLKVPEEMVIAQHGK